MAKSIFPAGLALALLTTAPAFAQAGYSGTWKVDLTSGKSSKPDVMLIKDGQFSCKSCVPIVAIPADGAFHATPGHPFYDEMAVKIVGPAEVAESQKLKGKLMGTSSVKALPGGKTLQIDWTDLSGANGQPMKGSFEQARLAPAPAGAHAVSGSWIDTNKATASDNAMTVMLKVTATTFTFNIPTGEHYTATFGGPAVPVVGDVAHTMVAAKKLPDGKVQLDLQVGGKPVQVITLALAKDGKSLSYTLLNVAKQDTTTMTAHKVG